MPESAPRNVTVGPVVSELAQRWLDGDITSEDYFAQCRRKANAEAQAHVAGRLAGFLRSTRRQP